MNTKLATTVLMLLVTMAVVIGVVMYPSFPDRIATHWNAQGVADGFSGKFFGVFLMPIVLLFLVCVFLLVPVIDPLRENIKSFRRHYNLFWVAACGFMFYMFILTVAYNRGLVFDFSLYMLPGFAVLIWFVGILTQHAKRSWFVGIRTPWTMSDDVVWEKTHRLGGKLFKAAAVITLGGFFVRDVVMMLFILVPVLSATLIATVYSFIEYRRRH